MKITDGTSTRLLNSPCVFIMKDGTVLDNDHNRKRIEVLVQEKGSDNYWTFTLRFWSEGW